MVRYMEYIILDLEWNNGYCKQLKKPINEIIEIGALRVDQNLNICDGFKQLVQPALTKKLSGRVKELTHITNDDVKQDGIPFLQAIDRLLAWLGEEEKIFMTWSNTDIYILAEMFQYYEKEPQISFIKKYVDAQKYCQSFFTDLKDNNQISLLNAAIKLDIDRDEGSLHRALADCVLTAKCFIKCYDETRFEKFIRICDDKFFERLMFKSFYITDLSSVGIRLEKYSISCPECQKTMRRISSFELVNNSFRAVFLCRQCRQRFYVTYRIKQLYDYVDVKKRITQAKKVRSHALKPGSKAKPVD